MNKKIIWGWILVLLIPASIVLFAIIAFLTRGLDPFTPSVVLIIKRIANVIIFLAGAIGVLGFIPGIILLAIGYTEKAKTN